MNNYYKKENEDYNNNYYENNDDYMNISSKDSLKAENNLTSNFNVIGNFSKNIDNKEYFKLVSKGFVWIFMFLVSFFTLFVIFKTPYYLYYNQTKPISIQQNMNNVTDLIDKSGPATSKNLSQIKKQSSNNENQKVINKEVSSNKNIKLDTVKNNSDSKISISNVNQNTKPSDNKISNSNSDITTLLKQNTISHKNSIINSGTSSITTTENTTNTSKNLTKKNVVSSQTINKVWVVNIFSSSKKETLYNKLAQLKYAHSSILNDKLSYYFTTNLVNNAYTYRIALANKDKGYFSSALAAKNFCLILKKSNIDCFISEISYTDLLTYIVK